jgi:hypothetical protein
VPLINLFNNIKNMCCKYKCSLTCTLHILIQKLIVIQIISKKVLKGNHTCKYYCFVNIHNTFMSLTKNATKRGGNKNQHTK